MLSFTYLKSTLGIFLVFGLVSISCSNQTATYPEKASMNTLVDSVSYAIGYQNGSQLTAQGFENADLDNFIAGFQAGQALATAEQTRRAGNLQAVGYLGEAAYYGSQT